MLYVIFIILLIFKLTNYIETFQEWINSSSWAVGKYKIKDGKIYKKFNERAPSYDGLSNKDYIEKMYHNYLKHWYFVPRMEFSEDYIIEDYYDTKLTKENKPKDYKEQLLRVHKTIRDSNMYHNDYKSAHFFVKNRKIYLIDWNNFLDYEPKWALGRNNINKYINKLK